MFKKIFLSVVLLLGLSFVLSGCDFVQNTNTQKEEEKIKVAASIFPLYDITREIAGDKADVNLVLPAGASPHTFDVTTSQIKDLQNNKVFFSIGAGFDEWTETVADSVDGSEIIELADYMTLTAFDDEHHEEKHEHENEEDHEHEHGEFDPHFWLSPSNAYIVADVIRDALVELSPEDEEYFNVNHDNFESKLLSKDLAWQEKMSKLTDKNIVVFHDAWGYFADSFGLTIVGTFEPFPGQEPSPQYLKELQETVKEKNIKTLFVEPQLSQSSIKTLASDLGVEIKVLDPLGGVDGRMSYIEMMEFNVENVYNLLKDN